MVCRDRDSKVRTPQVLEFCSDQPRTMEEIVEHFSSDARYRYAVYNAVAHGKMRNINAGQGRSTPGLYVTIKCARPKKAAQDVVMSTSLDWAAGKALAQAWGARA